MEETGTKALEEKVIFFFKKKLSKILKLPAKVIQAEKPLEQYGINSIMVIDLTAELEKTFGSLSKTLFFEYQNIQEISQYFLESYPSQLNKLLNVDGAKRAESRPVGPSRKSSKKSGLSRFGAMSPPLSTTPLDIAVIGLSGRYPQARNLEEYWQNLHDGKDCIIMVPKDRWDWREHYTKDRSQPGRHYNNRGGFIADVDKFDPLFFNISPREAELMDPQERLFLEHVWIALEDAGYTREDLQVESGSYLAGQVGVYAGVMYGDYQLFGAEESLLGNPIALSSSYASIANRVSYVLNLHGPSMTIDTMCSSSLTTLHLACQDLKHGRTDLGIAGGVNVSIHPNKYLMLSAGQFISSRSHCESFGEGGDGYVPGEGVGVALLKRLSDAKRDGDHIYGIIKGSAVNHGGKTNGYTVPNPNAQKGVILRALKESGIDSRAVSYIEAHGTGTKLGDPIEITGLSKAFDLGKAEDCPEKQYCQIGSVKSNIGHCESAAGIAGLTKVLLQMQHGQIAPSLHSKALNPNIDFANTPFVVNQELRDWQNPIIDKKEYPKIGGISSFGAGGSNAHMLIEEFIPEVRSAEPLSPVVIVLSARNQDRLKEYAKSLLRFIETTEQTSAIRLTDLAYTLQIGREGMEERLGLIAHSTREIRGKLRDFIEGSEDVEELYLGQVKRNKDTLALFTADEDLQQALEAWISKGKLSKLLTLWVKGLRFDWNKLYGEIKPQRISAPTYPFSRERYWVESKRKTVQSTDLPPPVSPSLESETSRLEDLLQKTGKKWLFLKEDWELSPLEIETELWTEKIEANKNHDILVIGEVGAYDSMKNTCQMIAKLSENDENLWNISHLPLQAGVKYKLEESDIKTCIIASDSPQTIFLLLPQIANDRSECQELELVYACVQSLLRVAATKHIQFYCCYQDQSSEGVLYREGLGGLFKSAMLESLNHRYRSISYEAQWLSDGQADSGATSFQTVALRLIHEWLCDGTTTLSASRTPMVRLSEGNRFELQVKEIIEYEQPHQPVVFRERGTFLMVGALGEVGELICQELGERYQAQLVIFSRRTENEVKNRLERIEASGASVIYRSVDILDKKGLDQEMKSLREEEVQIHGVIHMARQVSDAPILKKSFTEFSDVMSAKVQGTLNIDAVTAKEPLDFFLIYSSMAAFGIKGSPDYAYATAFQNAMVRNRNHLVEQKKRSGRTFAICWGQWEMDGGIDPEKMPGRLEKMRRMGMDFIDVSSSITLMILGLNNPWDVVGMVAVNDKEKVLQMMGFDQVNPKDKDKIEATVEAFENEELSKPQFIAFLKTLKDSDYTESIQNKIIHAMKRSDRQKKEPVEKSSKLQDSPNAAFKEEVFIAKHAVSEQSILETVRDTVRKVLKIKNEVLDLDRPLLDYGLDSVSAMQLANTLEKELKFSIPPNWFVEHPTLNFLADKLSKENRYQGEIQ